MGFPSANSKAHWISSSFIIGWNSTQIILLLYDKIYASFYHSFSELLVYQESPIKWSNRISKCILAFNSKGSRQQLIFLKQWWDFEKIALKKKIESDRHQIMIALLILKLYKISKTAIIKYKNLHGYSYCSEENFCPVFF